MVIGKCTDVFRGLFRVEGGGLGARDYVGGSFQGVIYHEGRKFPQRGCRIF